MQRQLVGGDPVLAPPASTPLLRVAVLDGFELTAAGLNAPVPPAARRVIAFLALHDRPLQRVYVAGCLWSESTDAHAAASLRTALWRLRGPAAKVVRVVGDSLSIDRAVEVDLQVATINARRLLEGGEVPEPEALSTLCTAGDLLPDCYEDWVLVAREQFRQLRLHALEGACDSLVADGRFGEAVQAGLAAISVEPLRESAHRAVVRAHLAEGNAGEALRHYGTARRLLERELGIGPSAAMEALVEPVRRR